MGERYIFTLPKILNLLSIDIGKIMMMAAVGDQPR